MLLKSTCLVFFFVCFNEMCFIKEAFFISEICIFWLCIMNRHIYYFISAKQILLIMRKTLNQVFPLVILDSLKNLRSALFNQCAQCTKICVECTTTKGFTRVHHKLVTLNRYFLQKLFVRKNEPLTNQWLSGFNLDFAHSKVWCVSIRPCQANCCN